MSDISIPHKTNGIHTVVYSPAAIVSIINAHLSIREEKKIIQLRGIFKKTGTSSYGGHFYNRLKDEASDYQITLITSALLHHQLEDNKTIEFNGFITRKMDRSGRIEIQINMIDLISQQVNKYSDEEIRKISVINNKVALGFKDLDAAIKNAIFHNKPFRIRIILGKSAIIDHDIKKGMADAIALYKISYHPVSLSSPQAIKELLISLDTEDADLICIARGGGENLEIFDNIEICKAAIGRNSIIGSAIGHDVNVTLFEKIADKKFSLPFHFGSYLKEIYNSTIEDFQQSRAKIVKDVETQLNTQYCKKIETLNQQLTSLKQLGEKTIADTHTNYKGQLVVLEQKLKSQEELSQKTLLENAKLQNEKLSVLNTQLANLTKQQSQKDALIKQANDLANSYKRQAEQAKEEKGVSFGTVLVIVIVALLLGLFLANGFK